MAVVINTNVDSIRIRNILNSATTNMSETMQRMSSGLQILSAKDDAAGTVISARMKVQLNGNQIAQKNAQNASALLSTAEGNLDVIEANISRIRDLTLQAKNGTYSEEEIQAMQDEVQERIDEINRVNSSAKYSQLQLFGDTSATGLATKGATFQVGADDGVDNTIKADASLFSSVEFSAMTGAKSFNLVNIAKGGTGVTFGDPTSGTSSAATYDSSAGETVFDQAIRALDNAIDDITSRKSVIGSAGSRMESALDTLTTQYENLASANSLIVDSDIAEQASKYTQESILQQISTSLLAQANQAPSVALSLV